MKTFKKTMKSLLNGTLDLAHEIIRFNMSFTGAMISLSAELAGSLMSDN